MGSELKIKSIILKDFKKYQGRQEIKFATNHKRYITVICGQNASGKTTIIEAFMWCLYGTSIYPKSHLLNVEIEHNLAARQESKVYVEITIRDKNTDYTIRRVQTHFKNENNELITPESEFSLSYENQLGKVILVTGIDVSNQINTIFPKEISDYVFLDHTKLKGIDRQVDLNAAIRKMTGLDVVRNDKGIDVGAYPLILDAPFTYINEENIVGLLEGLVTHADQVVLLLQETELGHFPHYLKEKIGCRHDIEIIDNSSTRSAVNRIYIMT